jgi:chemotaxis protein methyltransferase CheR
LRWFDQTEEAWIAKAELRASVHFARANLLDAPTDAPRFDIIFCRHLLSDADPIRRSDMIDNLERRLVDDGCLFLGSEEQPEDSLAFRPVAGRKGLFVKSPSAVRRAA